MIESENTPKEVDLVEALPDDQKDSLPFVTDVCTGMRTMLVKDHEDRVFKTGLKIDWNPRMAALNKEKIAGEIKLMSCGRQHYVLLDSKN